MRISKAQVRLTCAVPSYTSRKPPQDSPINAFADTRTVVLHALDALTGEGVLPGGLEMHNVAVEPPRDAAHGDMATNAAMVLAKPA